MNSHDNEKNNRTSMPQSIDAKITRYNLSFLLTYNDIGQSIPWKIDQRNSPYFLESHHTRMVMQLLFLCLAALLQFQALGVQLSYQPLSLKRKNQIKEKHEICILNITNTEVHLLNH